MSVITFPKILTERLTDEGAKALADIFNTVESSAQRTTLEIAEERFERRLAQLDAKIDTVAAKLDAKIDTVEARLDAKIDKVAAQIKAELIKWMFIFWVGQAITTFGMLQVFLSKH